MHCTVRKTVKQLAALRVWILKRKVIVDWDIELFFQAIEMVPLEMVLFPAWTNLVLSQVFFFHSVNNNKKEIKRHRFLCVCWYTVTQHKKNIPYLSPLSAWTELLQQSIWKQKAKFKTEGWTFENFDNAWEKQSKEYLYFCCYQGLLLLWFILWK